MAVITIREKQPTENGFAASLIFEGGEYPINITDPFTPQQEQQLEWYFEEWLTYPSGISGGEYGRIASN